MDFIISWGFECGFLLMVYFDCFRCFGCYCCISFGFSVLIYYVLLLALVVTLRCCFCVAI